MRRRSDALIKKMETLAKVFADSYSLASIVDAECVSDIFPSVRDSRRRYYLVRYHSSRLQRGSRTLSTSKLACLSTESP